MVLDPDDVAHHDPLTPQGLQLAAAEHLDLAMVDLAVTLVAAVILVTLEIKKSQIKRKCSQVPS